MAKVVRLDNMAATHVPALIKSVRYYNADAVAEVENGTIVAVGALEDGEREVHKATDATADSVAVGIVCAPEVDYDQRGVGDTDLANFKNAKGEVVRVMLFQRGDIFSIANEGSGADKSYADVTAKFLGTEVAGRYTYNVYEVQ